MNILPAAASAAAPAADTLLVFTIVVCGVLALAVAMWMGYSLWPRRRMVTESPDAVDGRPAPDPPGTAGKRAEILFAAGAAAVMGAVLAAGIVTTRAQAAARAAALAAAPAYDVEMLAQQFVWYARAPGADGALGRTDPARATDADPFGLDPADAAGADDRVTLGELTLPLGRATRIVLRSRDVIHGFHVPEFRQQMNVLPGQPLAITVVPTRAGAFEIRCNQFCGLGHYRMRAVINVAAAPRLNVAPAGAMPDLAGDRL